jgi:hypothetical protein
VKQLLFEDDVQSWFETLSPKWGWNLHRHGKSVWFQLAAWPER